MNINPLQSMVVEEDYNLILLIMFLMNILFLDIIILLILIINMNFHFFLKILLPVKVNYKILIIESKEFMHQLVFFVFKLIIYIL